MGKKKSLPGLYLKSRIDPDLRFFLKDLAVSGFNGDIETSYSSRLVVATDNSVYQQLPQAVLFPKSTEDVILIGKISSHSKYKKITFSGRGGGTGTNGQSLTKGVVVDFSRHMNGILEINEEERWVRVQAGVIKDQLNDAVRPYGLFFAPELSTSNRATVGGMVNTDASGQGSLQYGKTSDHVLSLQAVFADGSLFETDGSAGMPEPDSYAANAYAVAKNVCTEKREQIVAKFPKLNRFLTGYDLKNAYDEVMESFNFTRILCGAEGTLAFITEARLNLLPIPQARSLVTVKYDSFESALRNAPLMVQAQALSVETVDSKVLELAREDIIWHSVSSLLQDVPGKKMDGINIVEFAGDHEEISEAVDILCTRLDGVISAKQSGIIGYQVCNDLNSINQIYAMRKKAVGLLGGVKGGAKPIAFAEDTCVPPENLADFIAEFRALLDSKKLSYGMFGHVDSGVLHVRPALDMCDPEQEQLMHTITGEVVELVAKYGGLLWGEHGRGYRSEYGPEFFGKELFTELRRIKKAFDPQNKMNPGKICTPLGSGFSLVSVTDIKRGFYDRQIAGVVRDSFRAAVECNGNGLCFNYDKGSPMCPSVKLTANRLHSPKGRAGLVREWLRLLGEKGVDILDLEKESLQKPLSIKELAGKVERSITATNEEDFSHEVYSAMNLCLACKACASQCPIKVDVPSFRARFLNLYHTRYTRPVRDYLVAYIEKMLPMAAMVPQIVNGVLNMALTKELLRTSVGYVDTPQLSVPTLAKRLKGASLTPFDLDFLASLSEGERQKYLLIVQDPFTSYYEAGVVEDFISLLVSLGKKPVLLPFKPNGKAQHIKGFLRQFAKTASLAAEFLTEIALLGIPMVGVDPALVLCYRDEYKEILQDKRGEFEVLLVHEWLLRHLYEFEQQEMSNNEPWYLLGHCTEKTMLPGVEKEWGEIFSYFGAVLKPVAVGCCGMAGTFGHEADKEELSKKIYALSWQDQLQKLPKERCLISGYSCRSQVKRMEGIVTKHPLQGLLALLTQK